MESQEVSEKRDQSEPRFQVLEFEVRGLLTQEAGKRQQPFLVWDLSPTGVGIWAFQELTVGEQVILTVGQPYLLVIKCEVTWCEGIRTDHGFRCGLQVSENNKEFTSLYQSFLAAKKRRLRFTAEAG